MDWWTRSASTVDAAMNLLKRIHRYKGNVQIVDRRGQPRRTLVVSWALDLVASRAVACAKSRQGRLVTQRAAAILADDPSARDVFDSVYRLSGKRAASAWVVALVAKPEPTLSPEEAKIARAHAASVAAAKRAAQREAHARRMLAKHERALKREERLVARWGRVVARYDRRAARGTG